MLTLRVLPTWQGCKTPNFLSQNNQFGGSALGFQPADLEKKIDGSSLQSFNVFQIFFVEINQISFFVSVVS